MTDTSFSISLERFRQPMGTWIRLLAMSCLLGILSGPAPAEKGSPKKEWMTALSRGSEEFAKLEVWTETWRYEIFDATAPISIERSDEWVASLRERIVRSATPDSDPKTAFALLVEEARRFFASPPEFAEVLSEIHQRDLATASYWVWEMRSGSLSKFERQGTWHQSEGVVAMGPPLSSDEIEMFLAELGVLIPGGAKALEVPSATPESHSERMTLQFDRNEKRLKMEAQPWRGILGPLTTEVYPLIEQEEGALAEKKHFFFPPIPGEVQSATQTFPHAAIEFRYDPDGDLISYAVIQIHSPVLDSDHWRPFPSARPPFGWTVLDYRFLPEREYTFGEIGR